MKYKKNLQPLELYLAVLALMWALLIGAFGLQPTSDQHLESGVHIAEAEGTDSGSNSDSDPSANPFGNFWSG